MRVIGLARCSVVHVSTHSPPTDYTCTTRTYKCVGSSHFSLNTLPHHTPTHTLTTTTHKQELKAEARGEKLTPSAGYTSAPQQLPQNATTPAASFSGGAGNNNSLRTGAGGAGAGVGGGYGAPRGAGGAAVADPYGSSATAANDGWGGGGVADAGGGYGGGGGVGSGGVPLRGRGLRGAAGPAAVVDEYGGSNVRGRGRANDAYGELLDARGKAVPSRHKPCSLGLL